MDAYERGRDARRRAPACRAFGGFDLENMGGDVAARMFLPPATEAKMEIARPMDRERREWIRGWNDEAAERRGET